MSVAESARTKLFCRIGALGSYVILMERSGFPQRDAPTMVLLQVGNRDARFVEEQSWYGVRRAARKHLSCNVLFAGATRNYLSFPV
jgi:hypothetical protein